MKKEFLVICIALVFLFCNPAFADLDVRPIYMEAKTCSDPARLRILKWQIETIEMEFPHSEQKAVDLLAKKFKDIRRSELRSWLTDKKVQYVVIDGQKRYFSNFIDNMGFRNFKIMRQDLKEKGDIRPFFDELEGIIFAPPKSSFKENKWQPISGPVDYLAEVTLDLPRRELPKTGAIGLYIPLPIQTACQSDARLVSILPAELVNTVSRTDGDIGYVYIEVPLDSMKEDLSVRAQITFRHFEQHFQVDPGKVLPYDRNSDLYKTYTRSRGNTAITPEIAAEAKRVAAGEKNPYRIAEKLYHHVVNNIKYSFLPHGTMWILKKPESVTVYENRYGDCGAQSMFFAALCRSMGIPARSTGGRQLVPGWSGSHFWAEFYLEGYGWLPVDTSIADAADWTGSITEEQRQTYKNFFFGRQDAFRYVIQRDVDLPMRPAPKANFLSGDRPMLAFQNPWLDCADCKTNPMLLIDKYYTIQVAPLYH